MHSLPGYTENDQANMVHEVEVAIGAKSLKARYYIEGGVIVAMVENKTYRCPVGSVASADTVRAMLTELALEGQL